MRDEDAFVKHMYIGTVGAVKHHSTVRLSKLVPNIS